MLNCNIRGDNYTYSKLINSLINDNMVDDACSICQDSFANKINLEAVTYNSLLYACAYSNNTKYMRYGANISDQMRQIGIICDEYIQGKLVMTLAEETCN